MSHQPAPVRTWRAALIIGLVVSLAVGAAAFGWWFARESPAHQGPIVLIAVDGLSGSEMAAYGAAPGRTPQMDALAADSVVFERAYTHSPLIVPALVSMLTGQIPPAHGVRHDVGFALSPDARTLAELLRSRGFATGAAVSSYLLRQDSGLGQGFGFFDAEFDATATAPLPAVSRGAGATFEAATTWLRLQSGQRYFLFLQLPHADADQVTGAVIDMLRQRGLYDGATVILVGSRGEAGNGLSLDEATLRVPLLVKQPGQEEAGTRVAATVQHVDLLPTILDLVRAPIPGGLQGQSLRYVLNDPTQALPTRPVFSESLVAHYLLGTAPAFAVANERQRLVRRDGETLVPIDPPGPKVDGRDSPDAVPLRAAMDAALKGRSVVPEPAAPLRADWRARALLGYLDGPRTLPPIEGAIEEAAEAEAVGALQRAAPLVAADRLAEAIRTLQPVAASRSTLAAVHYQLGRLLARSGRLTDAAVSFRLAAAAAPMSASLATWAADVLRRAGRLADARVQVEHALVRAEGGNMADLAEAHEVAARIALAQKDTEAARRHADLAQRADPDRPIPAFVRGTLAAQDGRQEESVAAFAEAVAALTPEGPRVAELHQAYGDALERLQRHADAKAQFTRQIDAFPESPGGYASLANLLQATERGDEVEGVVARLLEAIPTPEGYATAMRVWTAAGDKGRARQVRAEALTRFPGDSTRVLLDRAARR